MKLPLLIITATLLLLFSCKKDDEVNCTLCSSEQTSPFEVCRESNGEASVNGDNTGTNYDVYLADLMEAGTTCGN